MLVIKSRRRRALALDEPLKHGSHKRPVTRRDFLAQGFLTGAATVVAPTMLGSMLNPRRAGAIEPDLDTIARALSGCNVQASSGKVPFVCFDLAGGANIAGSNVLAGGPGGQLDFLSTQGYSKQGLPGNMLPNNATTNFIDIRLGLAFHSQSAFLRGIAAKASPEAMGMVDGIVIPARSENDTGNNPHNPMYGIARAGARGELLTLIGSQTSDSGGNSMAPAMLINPELRPTKIDRYSDVKALGSPGPEPLLGPDPTVRVSESMARLTGFKLGDPNGASPTTGPVNTGLADDLDVKKRTQCAYIKNAMAMEDGFLNPSKFDPANDPFINAIFPGAELTQNEFQKTAAVMKVVVPNKSINAANEPVAGAGTITMGGFDYHTGDRATGEGRDFRAGQCIGAVIEFAHRCRSPVMIYVFSDGSVSSNGRIDTSVGGGDKGEWTSDNQQTAASFILVYKPGIRPALTKPGRQIGAFSSNGDVVTSSSPAANSVVSLAHMVILNYMALNGDVGQFPTLFGSNIFGASAADLDRWIGFQRLA